MVKLLGKFKNRKFFMQSPRIKVSDRVLKWAIKNGECDSDTIKKKYSWVESGKSPTLIQLKNFSNSTKIPFSYLLLSDPPEENIELVKFRTCNNANYIPSRSLIDTINIMESRQEWMNDYRKYNGQDSKIDFINSIDLSTLNGNEVPQVAHDIRKMLKLDDFSHGTDDDFFKYIRKNISNSGVLVMQNGVVANQTRRHLDVNEFRAFTLIDDISPLIFINNQDSIRAKIFSLVHEFIHLLCGINELLNDDPSSSMNNHKKEEQIINNLTAKVLMPSNRLKRDYQCIKDIDKISRKYHVSKIALAIELKRLNLITKNVVVNISQETQDVIKKKKSSGGDYYNTKLSRIDSNFMYALTDATDSGYTSIDEASYLSCAPNSFNKLKKEFKAREGIPW